MHKTIPQKGSSKYRSIYTRSLPVNQSRDPRTRNHIHKALLGFTLIELIVAIAMAAILLTIAVPSFNELIKNTRIASSANELLASLQHARSEAATRKETIALCTSSEGMSSATPGCNSAIDWSDGWIIFIDRNNDGTRNTASDSTESVIKVHEAMEGGNLSAIGETSVAHNIRFYADGTASASGNVSLCDNRGSSKSKSVTIERYTGRTFVESGNGSCP